MKIQVDPIVVVEGKYDKIKLESVIDGLIVATDGFGIFKDKDVQKNLKKMAKMRGVIILTDSDRGGFIIRKFLHDILNSCTVYDIYIPDIYGKEKRKSVPSAEGKLGVEGMTPEVLGQLFGSFACRQKGVGDITTTDLYEWGLFGGEKSAEKRRRFQHHLGLPGRLNKNMLLKILNMMFTKEQCLRQIEISEQ